MATYRISIPEMAALKLLFRQAPQRVGTEMHSALGQAVAAARAEIEAGAPVNTGRLAASITGQTTGAPPREQGIVSTDCPYAGFVEFGTAPHEIVPVTAKALRFQIGGKVVFSKRVAHPGSAPHPFFAAGIDAAEPAMNAAFVDALSRVIGAMAEKTG